jgi:hypothetical protein
VAYNYLVTELDKNEQIVSVEFCLSIKAAHDKALTMDRAELFSEFSQRHGASCDTVVYLNGHVVGFKRSN